MVIITGGIDLSVGSVLCLSSMVLGVTMHAGYSLEVGIAASIATALTIGAFNGVLIAYLGFPPFVVTLGMLSIARSLAMVASNNTVVFEFGPDHDLLLQLGGGSTFRYRQSRSLHDRAGAHNRLCLALDEVRPPYITPLAAMNTRRPYRCAGEADQGCGLYDLGACRQA